MSKNVVQGDKIECNVHVTVENRDEFCESLERSPPEANQEPTHPDQLHLAEPMDNNKTIEPYQIRGETKLRTWKLRKRI